MTRTTTRLIWGLVALFVSLAALAASVIILPGCAMSPVVDTPTFSRIEEAGAWIDKNVTYVSDPLDGYWDAWQTPEETLARRAGDCEDHAILWLYLVHESFGEKGELVCAITPDGAGHASARLGAVNYYDIKGQTELFTISYDDAMNLAIVKAVREEGK